MVRVNESPTSLPFCGDELQRERRPPGVGLTSVDACAYEIELAHSFRGRSVRRMFAQISPRYDLMNRLMSAGQDLRWRKLAVQAAQVRPGDLLLDVAAGTGDMARIARAMVPDLRVVAADFSLEMMRVGRNKALPRRRGKQRSNHRRARPEDWAGADTYVLPFPSRLFDAVTSAFLLRNLDDPLAALREQIRVLKPGGRLVALDATPPPANRLRPLVNFYLGSFCPLLGGLVAGQPEAYRYLPDSIANFRRPEGLVQLFREASLQQVHCRSLMLGTATIVVGTRLAGQ